MERTLSLNYIGGREAVLEQARAISRIRSIPKEKIWDCYRNKHARASHPYRLGCECPSCGHVLYQMLEVSRG
jgi:hypothetical protein